MPALDWFRRALGRASPAAIPDRMWQDVTARMPFLVGLSDEEMQRLRALAQDFLAQKEFTAASGFHLDDEICLSIAIQGCLPILNLGLDWYRGWHGIIVYPDEFVIPRQTMDEDGVVHAYDEIASGEAWSDGPVLISWQDVEMSGDGYNVVIHEFAHKLDMLNGDPDGLPPLHKGMSRREWMRTLEAAYEALCDEVDAAGDDEPECFLDPYAAEHPAEFFAVASEAFFDTPHELRVEYPELYEQFVLLYRQDPAARMPEPWYDTDPERDCGRNLDRNRDAQ